MKFKLLSFLDFFYFKKELKKFFDISFFQFFTLTVLDKYIFLVTQENGSSMIWKTQKNDENKFEIEKIHNLNKKKINKFQDDYFDLSDFIYVTNNDTYDIDMLDFKESCRNLFMKLNIENFNFDDFSKKYVFERLKANNNEKERCLLQNDAFFDESRIPIKIKDIKYEMSRKCFLDNLAYFLKLENEYIGYGQVMILENKFTIANLCIKTKFQGKGYGKILLKFLLKQCKEQDILDIYIKVNSENRYAYKLYCDVGFEVIDAVSIYQF